MFAIEIEQSLAVLLGDLSGILSSSGRAEVVKFIEASEYGVALETLAALLVEECKAIPFQVFERISGLAEDLGLRESIPTEALRAQMHPRKGLRHAH